MTGRLGNKLKINTYEPRETKAFVCFPILQNQASENGPPGAPSFSPVSTQTVSCGLCTDHVFYGVKSGYSRDGHTVMNRIRLVSLYVPSSQFSAQ